MNAGLGQIRANCFLMEKNIFTRENISFVIGDANFVGFFITVLLTLTNPLKNHVHAKEVCLFRMMPCYRNLKCDKVEFKRCLNLFLNFKALHSRLRLLILNNPR